MSFVVAAESYDRFMGRYSRRLAPLFAGFAGVRPSLRVLEVGCGTGALTSELVKHVGAGAVTAVDPSEPFVTSLRERHPDVEVHQAAAEELPFEDATFDLTLAQLVVHHLDDPVAGVADMARVTRPGGTVAACVWDHGGGKSPLTPFWRVVSQIDVNAPSESQFPGSRRGELRHIFEAAGLGPVESDAISLEYEHDSFEDWWEPFTMGVGPAGVFVAELEPADQARLRELCRQTLPPPPFVLSMQVWATRGAVPG